MTDITLDEAKAAVERLSDQLENDLEGLRQFAKAELDTSTAQAVRMLTDIIENVVALALGVNLTLGLATSAQLGLTDDR